MGLAGIVLFILLGTLLIIIELFFLMGSVKFGLAGLVAMMIGIYMVYANYGLQAGNIALVTSLVGGVILTIIAIRLVGNREVGLTDVLDGKVNVVDKQKVNTGDTGEAFGDLKLSGRININGEILDAESTGDFIEDGTKVMVTKVTQNQIFVKSVEDDKYMG